MAVTYIGSGDNTLLVRMGEDAYLGDAQYTLAVDGVPVDGTLTAHAGEQDLVTIRGEFTTGPHTLTVNFLNDAYAGTPDTDRNLRVEGVVADGTAVPASSATLYSTGALDIPFTAMDPPAPVANSIGSGPDTLLIHLSQNYYLENARYTVSVDGVQIDGEQQAVAWHDTGARDSLAVHGSFAPGPHTVTVNYLNDRWDGTYETDRNLYVSDISLNGVAVPGSSADLLGPGPRDFGFTEPGGSDTTIGSGGDTLVLKVTQDFYLANAQYTVSVDGVPVDGTLTAAARSGSGAADTVTVKGDWGPGSHTVTVNFLNDAYAGTPDTDRNLHVEGISYNGAAQPGGMATLFSAGPQDFGFTDTGTPVPTTASFGTGADALQLRISQDFYLANAQYRLSIDGVPVDGVQTASAYHSAGQDDLITINGDFAPGSHTVTVEFLNDAWDGGSGDRNLYVDGITLNGTAVAGGSAALLAPGPQDFIFSA